MDPRHKAWIHSHSLAGIVGSDPAGGHGCQSLLSAVCFQVEFSVMGQSTVQRCSSECVCVSPSVIRCSNNPLHLQWVGRKGQPKKEIKFLGVSCYMHLLWQCQVFRRLTHRKTFVSWVRCELIRCICVCHQVKVLNLLLSHFSFMAKLTRNATCCTMYKKRRNRKSSLYTVTIFIEFFHDPLLQMRLLPVLLTFTSYHKDGCC